MEMKFLELCFGLLCCVILDSSYCVGSENFIINRTTEDFGDKFDIPSITCSTIVSSSKCSQYGAKNRSENECQCKCPSSNATFSFHNGTWSCMDDRIIREREGCKVTFRDYAGQFKTLTKQKGSLQATNILQKSGSEKCLVDVNASKYLGCDSNWYPLQANSTLFQTRNINPIYLRVRKETDSSEVDGRVIKLAFTAGCSGPVTKPEELCLIFKLEGFYQCEVPIKLQVTPSLQASTEHIRATVIKGSLPISTPSTGIVPPTTENNPTISMSVTGPIGPGGTTKVQEGVAQSEIIVIAVSGNVVLITIIAVLIFAMCRMKRRHASVSEINDESPYAEIPFGDDSILIGNHAYARLYSTTKKKTPHQRRELDDLKNFPNPSFEDVPYEIPLPPPANGQISDDEIRSYARLYNTTRTKKKTKRKDLLTDSGVDSVGTSSEDLSLEIPISVESEPQQQDIVFSYAIPDLPEINTMPRVPKPRADINPENRESVTSSCFSYDYAVPDSPNGITSTKERKENPHSSISDTPDVHKPNCDSKASTASADSKANKDSGEDPYYHVLDPDQSASTSNLTENDSKAGKSTPHDCPEAVINAAFEDLKEHETDMQPMEGDTLDASPKLFLTESRYPHVLEEFNLRHSTVSEFSDYSSPSEYERKNSVIEEEDDEDISGGSSCNPEVPGRTNERLLEPFDSLSEHSSEVKAYSDTSSLSSVTRDDNKHEEDSLVLSDEKAYGHKMDSEIQEIEINLDNEENVIPSSEA